MNIKLLEERKLFIWMIIVVLLLTYTIHGYSETLAPVDIEFEEAMQKINENYVGAIPKEIKIPTGNNYDTKEIKKVFEKLDQHSNYYTKEEFDKLNSRIGGKSIGLGIYINKVEGQYLVDSVVKDGPADKSGMRSGDRIISINNFDVGKEKDINVVKSKLNGELGSKIVIKFERDKEVLSKEVTVGEVTYNPVSYKVINDIGYIRLERFTKLSQKGIIEALGYMDGNNIDRVILDLRDNPGGYLDEAINISRLFIPKGPVAHLKYKDGRDVTYSSNRKNNTKYNLVLLVDEKTASAGEVVAGAVKDTNAGVLIGQKTYGKGTIQEIKKLPNGDGVKVTVAEYFSPNKNKIEGIGVQPHIVIKNEKTDLQLLKAIETLVR